MISYVSMYMSDKGRMLQTNIKLRLIPRVVQLLLVETSPFSDDFC